MAHSGIIQKPSQNEWLKPEHKHVGQDYQCSSRDSNQAPSKYFASYYDVRMLGLSSHFLMSPLYVTALKKAPYICAAMHVY